MVSGTRYRDRLLVGADTVIATVRQDAPVDAHREEWVAPEAIDERPTLPLALTLILLSVFLPEGMSFFVAGLRLTVTRVIFLVLVPTLFLRFGQKIAAGRYAFVASDLFVPLASLWMFLGPAVIEGLGESLAHSGPVVLEYLIGYMSTRTLLTRNGQALSFVSLMCFIICFVVLDAFMDTLTGTYITREVVSEVTGFQKIWHVADEIRFGLLRATGPLEHPIVFGFASAIGLLFAAAVPIRRRPFCIALCGLGVVIAFSSAPQQSAIMGFGFLAYGRLTSRIPGKWMLIYGVAVLAVTVVLFTVSSPLGHIIDVVTLDPQTGYYRLYIWNTLGPVILDNPYFGVQQEQIDVIYEGSVDSLWLVLSLTYGIPCAILMGLAIIGSCSRPTDLRRASLTKAESRVGTVLGIVLFLIMFTGFTVHYWGSIWILIGLLVGLRAHLGELGVLNATGRPEGRASSPYRA